MRNRWYAYWRGIALRARRRMHGVPRTVTNYRKHHAAADYALHWALMWRRASPDPLIAAHGIPMPDPRSNMLLAQAEFMARTP